MILGNQKLHDLTNDNVLWDKVVEISSVGEQDVDAVAVADAQNIVAGGISVLATTPAANSSARNGGSRIRVGPKKSRLAGSRGDPDQSR